MKNLTCEERQEIARKRLIMDKAQFEADQATFEAMKRKATPIFSGVLAYFPDALKAVARVSKAGNDQHNPGQPLHWDRTKSTDEDDALMRHLTDRAKGEVFDTDGQRHRAKVAWRALAALQKELEDERDDFNKA